MKKKSKILNKEDIFNQLKIDLISRFYPLSNEDIIKYKDILNCDRYQLMANENINWNIELIKLLKVKIDCTAFWKLNNINFDITFFDEFDDIIDYSSIHILNKIVWSSQLVSKYGDKFDWNRLSSYEEVISNIEILRRYKDRFNWVFISERIKISFSDEIIQEFKDYWDWSKLSLNKNLPISLVFLEKYKDSLDFENLSRNPTCIDIILKYAKSNRWNWNDVIINPGFEYDDKNFELVFNYYSRYYILNFLHTKYNISNISKFRKTITFNFLEKIFHSPFTQKSYFVCDKFIEYFPWDNLCKSNIEVDLEFIIKFKEKINFKENNFLKVNGKLLDEDFIFNNIELFDLNKSNFYQLNINDKIIDEYTKKINWCYLSFSENIEWSWDFVSDNYEKLDFIKLSNNEKAYVDLIKKILSKEQVYSFLDKNI